MTAADEMSAKVLTFLLTRPSRDMTARDISRARMAGVFLLTRPSRDVTTRGRECGAGIRFLLTRPSRDVTKNFYCDQTVRAFLLTRPSRDVTIVREWRFGRAEISTHTSLAGRDKHDTDIRGISGDFYSHVPRGT